MVSLIAVLRLAPDTNDPDGIRLLMVMPVSSTKVVLVVGSATNNHRSALLLLGSACASVAVLAGGQRPGYGESNQIIHGLLAPLNVSGRI